MPSDRRQTPRIVVEPSLRARVVGLDADFSLVEMSFDGFRLEGPVAFVDGADYEILVSPANGSAVVRIEAVATFCHVLATTPRLMFDTGFRVSDIHAHAQKSLQALIEGLSSVLEFE